MRNKKYTEEATIIRASSLTGYPDCPRRGAARMFRREVEAAGFELRETPRGVGAAIGSAVHRSASVILNEKARSGALPPDDVAIDCATDSLAEQLREGIMFDGPRGTTRSRDEAERQTVSMALTYRRVIAPQVNPVVIEERLEAQIAPGLVLSGQPDLVAREPGQVRDLKTGARALGSHAPQIGAYSLLARSHGADIERAAIDFVQRVAPTKAQPIPISRPVAVVEAETAAANVLRHIEQDLSAFRSGDTNRHILPGDPWSFMANPASLLCAEKWCPAYGTKGPHAFCNEWIAKKSEE